MMTFEAGRDITLPVQFSVGGRPVIPDQGSAVLHVIAPDGSEIHSEPVQTGPTDHAILVTIAAAHNQLTTSFSRRRVEISATLNGTAFAVDVPYRLIPRVLYSTTPADVRKFLGVNETELPDEDIDLGAALLTLQFQTSREQFDDALVSGEVAELRANEAILYRTALDIIPSLSNRIAQEQSDGSITFRRHARKNFDELKKIAIDRLSAAMDQLAPQNNPGYSLLITTNDPDPITGA
ncbi:MAG: hypothetical protein K5863_08970 [Nitratireductor sp.]|uniref:hypothetical protein n=1 Tax=Nitratireductor sp. TaxID=1872084 RepID=UPI0026225F6F|nr:hypothetical protein [Nitratireductor sp.]MCV0350195.1 hypothetical protein [Nitratireductor sp.]